jgi:hypothetical protein
MKCRKILALFAAASLLAGVAGCSDDDGGNNNVQDAGPDVMRWDADGIDAEVIDGEVPDAGPVQGCTGDSPAQPQPMGACCNEDADCLDGFCLGGWCSTRDCESNADCDPTAPGPFPTGTSMTCNTNQLGGIVSSCLPGSLQYCGADGDSPCPAGEICVLAINDQTTDQTQNAERGFCVTALSHPGVIATGDRCDENADPYWYQCEAPSVFLGSCLGRRCTMACDPANPNDLCPAGMHCTGPLSFDVNGLFVGGGMCVGQSCGSLQFTGNPDTDVRIPGRDSECPASEVCATGFTTGADGDIFELNCVPEDTSKGAVGDACEHAAKFNQFCSNLELCFQAAAEWDPNGAWCSEHEDCAQDEVCAEHSSTFIPSHCSPKPDPGFCTMMCRVDSDCATWPGDTAYCVETDAGVMPNGEDAWFAVCYPEDELFGPNPTACTDEADCDPGSGEGCLNVSFHSTATFCATTVEQDLSGTVCTTVANCNAGEACIEGDTDSRCTAVKSVGDTCDATERDCLSGWCVDFEFEEDDNGSPTNTFCSASCLFTTDCGTNQLCENVLTAENDPATEVDNVTVGLCRTMVIRIEADRCTVNTDCTNASTGDTCDVPTGRCYTAAAAWGGACTDHFDCPQNGICDTDAPGGLCYMPGCDPAQGNGPCGGGDTTCSDNNVVGACVEACTTNGECTRNASDGHICVTGACEAP